MCVHLLYQTEHSRGPRASCPSLPVSAPTESLAWRGFRKDVIGGGHAIAVARPGSAGWDTAEGMARTVSLNGHTGAGFEDSTARAKARRSTGDPRLKDMKPEEEEKDSDLSLTAYPFYKFRHLGLPTLPGGVALSSSLCTWGISVISPLSWGNIIKMGLWQILHSGNSGYLAAFLPQLRAWGCLKSQSQPRPVDSVLCEIIKAGKGGWVGIIHFRWSAGLIPQSSSLGHKMNWDQGQRTGDPVGMQEGTLAVLRGRAFQGLPRQGLQGNL